MSNTKTHVNGKPPTVARCTLGADDENKRFVWRLKGGESGTLTCYSKSPWGIVVHWDNAARRTAPHFTDAETCDGCVKELPRKELYYLFAHHCEKNRFVFLELTENAARLLVKQLGAGESLRGAGLFVQRTKADNGRLQIRLMNPHPDPSRLPADEDPQATLLALWKVKRGDPRSGRQFPTGRGGFLPPKGRE